MGRAKAPASAAAVHHSIDRRGPVVFFGRAAPRPAPVDEPAIHHKQGARVPDAWVPAPPRLQADAPPVSRFANPTSLDFSAISLLAILAIRALAAKWLEWPSSTLSPTGQPLADKPVRQPVIYRTRSAAAYDQDERFAVVRETAQLDPTPCALPPRAWFYLASHLAHGKIPAINSRSHCRIKCDRADYAFWVLHASSPRPRKSQCGRLQPRPKTGDIGGQSDCSAGGKANR